MTKKRVLIVTGGNEGIHSVLDLTMPSKLRYAQKHGYDILKLRSFRSFPDINVDGDTLIGLGFSRVISVFQMVEHYDVVVWLDGDSIVTNESMRIEDIIDDKHTVFFSYDWPVSPSENTINKNFSSGNFIVQATSHVSELFQAFIHASQYFLDDPGADQSCLNAIYNQSSFKHCFRILDHQYLNAVPDFIMRTSTWRADTRRGTEGFKIVSPWDSDCFLAHLTGCSNEDRIDLLQNEFKHFL